MKKLTHKGRLRGSYAAGTLDDEIVLLRETKLYWVTRHGTKYSKANRGCMVGIWPTSTLNLDSIVPLKGS